MRLKKRLLLSHLAICIIPIVVITAIFFSIFYRSAVNDATLAATQTIRQIHQNIEDVLHEAEKTAALLEHEISIQQVLRDPPSPFASDSYAFTVRTNSYLNFIYKYSSSHLSDFYILGDYAQYRSGLLPFGEDTYANTDWYRRARDSESALWITEPQQSFVIPQKNERVITMLVPLKHTLEERTLGVTLVEIETEVFQSILDAVSLPTIDTIYLTDANGVTFLTSRQTTSAKSQLLRPAAESVQILSNGWELHASVCLQPSAFRSMFSIAGVLIVAVLLMLLIAVFCSVRTSRSVSQPISELESALKQVENGDFSIHLPTQDPCSEIRSMNSSFNVMVVKLNQLITQIHTDEKALRKAQLATLQAQINPHFLYNTLDTIAWNIRLDHPDDALLALQALTQLFRISISKGHDIISIEKEFQHVQTYLTIQKLRYSDKLNYSISVPPELKRYSTLKLILQPLVENSIYHGIKNTESGGRIDVSAHEEGDNIVFVVHDNGAGMTPEMLKHLNGLMKDPNRLDGKSFGVINVNTRIQMAYGPDYGIRYESMLAQYTTAYITIPKNHNTDQPTV